MSGTTNTETGTVIRVDSAASERGCGFARHGHQQIKAKRFRSRKLLMHGFPDGSQKFRNGEYYQDKRDICDLKWGRDWKWKPSIHTRDGHPGLL